MSKNFDQVLAEIKKIKNETQVYIPSQNKEVKVGALTIAQQKTIIESSIDNSLAVLLFNTTFFGIMQENVSENLANIDTIDRVNIALALRSQLKDEVTYDGKTYSLKAVLEANKLKDAKFEPQMFETEFFRIHVKKPSVELDNRLNSILLRKYKDESTRSSRLKNLISDLYSFEIYKFIDKLEYRTTGEVLDIKSDVTNGISLIEQLPSSEFVNVIAQINRLRDIEKEFTKIPDTNIYIEILPEFFVV